MQVDGGSTAKYVYDVFNQRVHVQTASATTEYIYDYAGRRVSSWLSPNNYGSRGQDLLGRPADWVSARRTARTIRPPGYVGDGAHADLPTARAVGSTYASLRGATAIRRRSATAEPIRTTSTLPAWSRTKCRGVPIRSTHSSGNYASARDDGWLLTRTWAATTPPTRRA